jgi:hypothetical protein
VQNGSNFNAVKLNSKILNKLDCHNFSLKACTAHIPGRMHTYIRFQYLTKKILNRHIFINIESSYCYNDFIIYTCFRCKVRVEMWK